MISLTYWVAVLQVGHDEAQLGIGQNLEAVAVDFASHPVVVAPGVVDLVPQVALKQVADSKCLDSYGLVPID